MKNLDEFFAEFDEKPERRAGGFILSMEYAAKARSRRWPGAEFRSTASRSRTPRLDAMRRRLAILTYMLEREEREEREP